VGEEHLYIRIPFPSRHDVHRLWTHYHVHLFSWLELRTRLSHVHLLPEEEDAYTVGFCREYLCSQKIRLPNLLQAPCVHDRDAIGNAHRLRLIMGDVQARDPQFLLDAANLLSGTFPELGVQIREGLVEQEHLGLDNDGPT